MAGTTVAVSSWLQDYAELEVLAQENLRLCKERDAKQVHCLVILFRRFRLRRESEGLPADPVCSQAERQARLTGLREEETTASARISVLTKQLEVENSCSSAMCPDC